MMIGMIIYAAVMLMWGVPILLGFSFWQVALAYGVIISMGTLTCLLRDI